VGAAQALGKSGTAPRTKLAHYFDETANALSSIVQRKGGCHAGNKRHGEIDDDQINACFSLCQNT